MSSTHFYGHLMEHLIFTFTSELGQVVASYFTIKVSVFDIAMNLKRSRGSVILTWPLLTRRSWLWVTTVLSCNCFSHRYWTYIPPVLFTIPHYKGSTTGRLTDPASIGGCGDGMDGPYLVKCWPGYLTRDGKQTYQTFTRQILLCQWLTKCDWPSLS